MKLLRHVSRLATILVLAGVVDVISQGTIFRTAEAQTNPGATVVTHHETIPNPVFNSGFSVVSACRSAVQACSWSNPGTWLAGRVPDRDTRVIIDGHVQIQDQNAVARSIGVYPAGKLTFSPNTNTRLQTADLIVFDGGTLNIGTNDSPIAAGSRAEVVFRDLSFDGLDVNQHLRGLLAFNGVVRIFGSQLNNIYLRTGVEPRQGDTTITTNQSVAVAGWRVGDDVMIPTSRQCAIASRACSSESEERNITGISADGLTITLDQPLNFSHPGARNHAGSLEYMPHVINKSRNVSFRSENPAGVRAHLLFHGRADVDMRYAEVNSMGRTSIQDLGSTNQKGRYPVHAHHLIGPTTPQSNSYQFTFIGNVIDFGAENGDQDRKWGISIHGSHFGLIERNVVDNASGAGIVTESGSEMGNMFRENFVVRVVGGNGARTEDVDSSDGTKSGRSGVGYWFNGGGRNYFEKNVAADVNVADCIYCYGFKFDNVRNGELTFPSAQGSDPFMDGGETVRAETVGLNNFTDNEAYAVPNGLTVWWECTFGDFPAENCTSRVDAFRVWHHHRWGYHGYPVSNMTLANFVVRGDPSVLSNRFENVTGLEFGDYMHRNLTIVNADIQNMRTGIQLSSMRHERGATGADVGFNTIEDSYIVATEGVGVWPPASVNRPTETLSPQTSVLRNVSFDYPDADTGGVELAHIVAHDSSYILDPDKMNTDKRNDILIYNYNSAPGIDGDDLYIVPNYHGPSRCDNTIGNCSSELTANYSDIDDGNIYALQDGNVPVDPEPPVIDVQSLTVNEDVGFATITVTLSKPSSSRVTALLHTRPGSAVGGSDYYGFTSDLIMEPGQTEQTTSFVILDDTVSEPTEQLQMLLQKIDNAQRGIGGVVTILDND